ncbi:MAG: hypothetical protein HC900_06495 [Methylacidiphilales bacterium]|nr:hypothetical protein [Candidatus Methylacidiphilales bacterium]
MQDFQIRFGVFGNPVLFCGGGMASVAATASVAAIVSCSQRSFVLGALSVSVLHLFAFRLDFPATGLSRAPADAVIPPDTAGQSATDVCQPILSVDAWAGGVSLILIRAARPALPT